MTPFLGADGTDPNGAPPIASPVFGAVQVEDFQLVPLLTALRMPRVSLLLADDDLPNARLMLTRHWHVGGMGDYGTILAVRPTPCTCSRLYYGKKRTLAKGGRIGAICF